MLESIANDMLEGKKINELYELADKFCKKMKFFDSAEKFADYLDRKLTKSETINFFMNSEIGYDAYKDMISVSLNDEGKPICCYIPCADYDDDEWYDYVYYHVRKTIMDCLRNKLTATIEEMLK